ncbi:MAG: hypothetical protein GPOALKHO_001271 [Sodalis sp.]|nr:MAG: hypothetical protein GPOALKHO_001271 [Sodalis sp.]
MRYLNEGHASIVLNGATAVQSRVHAWIGSGATDNRLLAPFAVHDYLLYQTPLFGPNIGYRPRTGPLCAASIACSGAFCRDQLDQEATSRSVSNCSITRTVK